MNLSCCRLGTSPRAWGTGVAWDSSKSEATIQMPDKAIVIPACGSSITIEQKDLTVYSFKDAEPRPEIKADRLYALGGGC